MTKQVIFERKEYIDTLKKRIEGIKNGYRQNIAVVGDEAIGKTTAIMHLLHNYYDNRIIFIYIDTRIESFDYFIKRFIGTMLYNFLSNSGILLREDLDFLIAKSEKYIPATIAKINLLLNTTALKKKDTGFLELLALCESINEETGKFCVVIFDEFQNIESFAIKNLYRQWSKALIMHKNTLFILVSSLKFKANQILCENLSLLFGNFQVLKFDLFNLAECERFISQRLDKIELDKAFRGIIVDLTGGNPYYIDLICNAIINTNCDVNQKVLVDILYNMLFKEAGILYQRFNGYLKSVSQSKVEQEYIPILYHIAEGRNRIKDISRLLNRQKKEILQKVNRLEELNVITRSVDFLSINDRMFNFWLKFVYREKSRTFSFDEKLQSEMFISQIEEMFREFAKSARQPLLERAMELLNMFEDDVVQIDKKKLQLSHFRELKPLNFNGRFIKEGLLGRSSDALWIMAFKPEAITEEDMREFASECRKFRHKTQRKIMVTLKDFDVNARLIAKSEKILAWDTNNFNFMLDLFNKPRVIA